MKKRIYLLLFFILLFFINPSKSFATRSQEWTALNYDINVLSNGDMEVIETWNIDITETNTLFKDFIVNRNKYSGISNVRVSRIENNEEIFLRQIYEEQYHVDPGCYYGLYINNESKFEIAWNVGLDNSSGSRIYKLYYTVKGAVNVYKDCAELYWQFVGDENEIEGNNITGTIHLPKGVSNIDNLRVWAHGPLDGEIIKQSNDTVYFHLPYLMEKTMLEVRVVTDENIYYIYDSSNENKLDSIIEEETLWANEANRKRKRDIITYTVLILLWLASNIVITGILISKARKYYKEGKKIEKDFSYDGDVLKYFRDIPDEKNATPARAEYLINYKYVNSLFSMDRVFSAILLDLSVKGYIEFKVLDKKEIEIILKNKRSIELPSDEQVILDLLISCSSYYNKDSFTTKEFSKYTKKEYEKVYKDGELIEKYASKYYEDNKSIDVNRKKEYEKWNKKWNGYFIAFWMFLMMIFSLMLFLPITVSILICSIICLINRNKIKNTLTEKGYKEQMEWNGLKNYIKDYSLLKEKTVPDIVLWEKYLVYATVFGISEKVIKQLKIDYPQLFDGSYADSLGRYSYISILNDTRLGDSPLRAFSSSLSSPYRAASSTYSAVHYSSSGSGGGGGFSGGGGGRRRWRPVLVAVKKYIK